MSDPIAPAEATLDALVRAVLAAIGRDALPAERALSRADAAAYVAAQVRLVVDDVAMARDAHFARAERAEEARDRAADAFDDLVARVWRAATGDEHEGPASVEALLDAVTALRSDRDAALAHAEELTAALRAAQDEVARLREDVSLWQRSAEAHRAEVVEARKSRDHWRECEERQRAATDDADRVACDLRDDLERLREERDALRTIVCGRREPPTAEDVRAIVSVNGCFRYGFDDGEPGGTVTTYAEATDVLRFSGGDEGEALWWAQAADGGPCVWPDVTEAPDAR